MGLNIVKHWDFWVKMKREHKTVDENLLNET